MSEMLEAGHAVYDELKNLLVWVKDNGGMGTFYRSRHELVFAFKKGTAPHINTFELGQHGRYRTNVWEYKGVNTLRAGFAVDNHGHIPDIVLDIFGGSGSTAIAAEKTGRISHTCEYEPHYCEIAIRRLEAFMKEEAVLVACGYDPQARFREAAE